jgi:hypothetical protein
MDKSFRDILNEFLERNEAGFTSEKPVKSPFSEGNSAVFEPLWRPDFTQNPTREGMNRYRVHVTPSPKVATPPPPPPVPEMVFPLAKLSAANSARVRELISFGAVDLTQGLSLRRLKKAHRLLARKFHPDRMTGATPDQVRTASAKFMAVQAAYHELLEYLLECEQDVKAA